MFIFTGKEKAFVGGLVTGLVTLIVQLQQSGQFTTKEFLFSLAAWVATHVAIYLTTNTPVTPPPIASPPVQ